MAAACRSSTSRGVSAVISSPSFSETAWQMVLTGQSPDRSYSVILPSASARRATGSPYTATAASWMICWVRIAHRVVVAVGLVQLQRGELRVVLEVRALVAELLAHLEHLLHAADDQPLQVQLGGDPEVEIQVVRVDVGLERAGVGAAVDELQDRRLHLGEPAPGQ